MLFTSRRGLLPLACLLGGAVTLTACSGSSSSRNETSPRFSATIERTQYGVPHITADSYTGLGYGHGYALAEDNLCVMASAFVTFRGERSRYFGPSELASAGGTFGSPTNIDADYFFRFIINDDTVTRFRDDQPAPLRELSQGFAAGFSRYVREVQGGEHEGRHQDCRDAEWLAGIDEDDMIRRMVALNLAASSATQVARIANAQPPSGPAPTSATDDTPLMPPKAGVGSNTYAFGTDATEGSAINFANPHWYLEGQDRFYQLQMTLPGTLDISGATIMGAPIVLMGFNNDIAWAHTVSTGMRFTAYVLQLNPNDPTQYYFDGELRNMQSDTIEIEVLQNDGSLATDSRTLYRSHYGPMIDSAAFGMPWGGNNVAITLRDANLENTRAFSNFFEWGHTDSLEDFLEVAERLVGIPWVNTTAAARTSDTVLYSDITTVPNVPTALMNACLIPGGGTFLGQGLMVLAGHTSACDWVDDPTAAQPGAMPASDLPHLLRTDYVSNMNDSYWLTNPDAPLTGFARIIGQEDYQQSLRTRMGLVMAQERLAGTDGLAGDKATNDNVRDIVTSSRNLSAELLKDEVLAQVCGSVAPQSNAEQACDVLTDWDNTGTVDARGAHVWTAVWAEIRNLNGLFAIPFDAADPVNTPRGLSTDSTVLDQVGTRFATAADKIADSGVAFDARLGDIRTYDKDGLDIPHPGGEGNEGYFTVLRNTYMHVVDFPDGEPVRAYTFVAHSQSTDPDSPHYADYTQAYSDGDWHRVPYTRADIEANRISIMEISE